MINEGLDADFFKNPRLQPMSREEYRNSPKRTTTAWDAEDHRLDGIDPDGGDARRRLAEKARAARTSSGT